MRISYIFLIKRIPLYFSLILLCAMAACVPPSDTPSDVFGNGEPSVSALPTKPSSEGNILYSFQRNDPQFYEVAWSPDNRRIASVHALMGKNIELQLWDALTGDHLVTYALNVFPSTMLWSPDGKYLAVAQAKTVEIRDATTGKIALTYSEHTASITSMAWSPDGRYIASGASTNDHTVQVWESTSGKNVFTYRNHKNSILSLAWSPDSKQLASCDGGSDINIWDAINGANARIYTIPGTSSRVRTLAWSPDGTRIAVAYGSGGVDLWDAKTGKILLNYRGYGKDDYPTRILWSPDSRRLATFGGFRDAAAVQVWDAATGNFVFRFVSTEQGIFINDAAWSPNGKYIATSYDKMIQVWDASPGGQALVYRGHKESALAVAWSPNGKYIASTDGAYHDYSLQVWEAITGKLIYTFHAPELLGAIAWSPDSKRIAVGSLTDKNSRVQVFDATSGDHLLTYTGHHDSIYSLSWSHDGKLIASGDSLGNIHLWDAQTGQLNSKYRSTTHFYTYSLAWSPDDHTLAAASGALTNAEPGVVDLWRVSDRNPTPTYTYQKHRGGIFTIAWSPDGKYIASAGADQTIQVWDALNGTLAFSYRGHIEQKPTGAVQQIAWSPNGKRIVSVSDRQLTQGNVQVWDALNGGHLYSFNGLYRVGSASWSSDSRYLVVGSADSSDSSVQVFLDKQ